MELQARVTPSSLGAGRGADAPSVDQGQDWTRLVWTRGQRRLALIVPHEGGDPPYAIGTAGGETETRDVAGVLDLLAVWSWLEGHGGCPVCHGAGWAKRCVYCRREWSP